ncbi:MAG TPA: hypothetical protein VFO85_22125 [Vicinamibacteria bacterium]|nr:hypothetical protein [Vicinamibacteria bacterium]
MTACLLMPQGGCHSGRDFTAAAIPSIADLAATPNPARPGEVVKISFAALDAGGGSGGEWIAFLTETPAAGGELERNWNTSRIKTSPARFTFQYFTGSRTTAQVEVWVTAYGACRGLFCEAPFNTAKGSVAITVLER